MEMKRYETAERKRDTIWIEAKRIKQRERKKQEKT